MTLAELLMPKATAVWLVDNTALTFEQIGDFVSMHPLEISGIADGEVAIGIKGFDPIANGQLTAEEIARCEKNGKARLTMVRPKEALVAPKRKGPRYTPLSKRQERPAAIAWLVRNHPELTDAQISKLVGTTKPTIESIRNRSHWNMSNIQPIDPVALGMCKQIELDEAVKKSAVNRPEPVDEPMDEDRLMRPEESLAPEPSTADELFGVGANAPSEPEEAAALDPESIFNLPKSKPGDDEDA